MRLETDAYERRLNSARSSAAQEDCLTSVHTRRCPMTHAHRHAARAPCRPPAPAHLCRRCARRRGRSRSTGRRATRCPRASRPQRRPRARRPRPRGPPRPRARRPPRRPMAARRPRRSATRRARRPPPRPGPATRPARLVTSPPRASTPCYAPAGGDVLHAWGATHGGRARMRARAAPRAWRTPLRPSQQPGPRGRPRTPRAPRARHTAARPGGRRPPGGARACSSKGYHRLCRPDAALYARTTASYQSASSGHSTRTRQPTAAAPRPGGAAPGARPPGPGSQAGASSSAASRALVMRRRSSSSRPARAPGSAWGPSYMRRPLPPLALRSTEKHRAEPGGRQCAVHRRLDRRTLGTQSNTWRHSYDTSGRERTQGGLDVGRRGRPLRGAVPAPAAAAAAAPVPHPRFYLDRAAAARRAALAAAVRLPLAPPPQLHGRRGGHRLPRRRHVGAGPRRGLGWAAPRRAVPSCRTLRCGRGRPGRAGGRRSAGCSAARLASAPRVRCRACAGRAAAAAAVSVLILVAGQHPAARGVASPAVEVQEGAAKPRPGAGPRRRRPLRRG